MGKPSETHVRHLAGRHSALLYRFEQADALLFPWREKFPRWRIHTILPLYCSDEAKGSLTFLKTNPFWYT